MRDKRPVDELSVEELERILAIKRREARQNQLTRMHQSGRVVTPEAHEPKPARSIDPVEAALARMTAPAGLTNAAPTAPTEPVIEIGGAPRFDDHADNAQPRQRETVVYAPVTKRKRSKWMDRTLLLVEVMAVILIGVIGVNLVGAINTLQEETASAQALADENRRLTVPTIAPTPQLRLEQVVLPGGHIFTAGGAPQFNYSEVPAHLIARVESEWVRPVINRPPRTRETALGLTIPRLGLDGTIVQGVDWEALRQGVGQVPNGVNPGDDFGNVVLAAHNDIYGSLFRDLDQLQIGDQFQVQTETQVHTYVVTETLIVRPNDVYVMENREGATVTLISCYPYQVNDQRYIVYADRVT